LKVNSLIERLHRSFLEVVKLELERLGIHDINNVQGMVLFNIGDAQMSVSELITRLLSGLERYVQCQKDGQKGRSHATAFAE